MNRNILANNLRRMTEAPATIDDEALIRLYESLRDCRLATSECIQHMASLMPTIRSRHARPALAA